jgi:ubiquinone/menaquinone biosynthesis C-methylase UbiE
MKANKVVGATGLKYQGNVRELISGDAKKMPYPDNFFDLSFTNVVLEQIPNSEDHRQVLAEMKRVSKKACLFLEPWKNSQNFLTLGYLQWIDYFREPVNILYELGFREVEFHDLDFHHNIGFRLGYAVAKT